MKILRKTILFLTGGAGYVGLELLWRGWSHASMFFAGGTCFLLLGGLERAKPRLSWPVRGLFGAGVITSVEMLWGLIFNRNYGVWDYRNTPLNFHGQVCLPFFALWIPVSLMGMRLYSVLEDLLILWHQSRRLASARDSAFAPDLPSRLPGRKYKDR